MTAYELGIAAHRQAFPLDRNPFAIGTAKWEAWRDGWQDTAKQANYNIGVGDDDNDTL